MTNSLRAAPIGVFDSGVGGLSVLRALRAELPHEAFVYVADSGFAPYGERGDAHVVERSRIVVRGLRERYGIKLLVVACNTATAAAIHLLRAENADLPIVGVEPAIKPAVANSRTRRIGVMATRGTLNSAKFKLLLDTQRADADFVLQPCDGLAHAIERGDAPEIEALSRDYTLAMGRFGSEMGDIDTLVLGCTHYPFAGDLLQQLAGAQTRLVETGVPVAQHTRRLLAAADALQSDGQGGLLLHTSGNVAALRDAADRWLAPGLAVSSF